MAAGDRAGRHVPPAWARPVLLLVALALAIGLGPAPAGAAVGGHAVAVAATQNAQAVPAIHVPSQPVPHPGDAVWPVLLLALLLGAWRRPARTHVVVAAAGRLACGSRAPPAPTATPA